MKKPQAPQVAKDNPALTTGSALGVVSLILGMLVTHHVIGSAHVGEIQQILDPVVLGAIPIVGGAITHAFVKPMSKIQAWIVHQAQGTLPDADIDRIIAGVVESLGQGVEHVLIGDDHPDAALVGEPTHPSRQAGTPRSRG